jgi:hypothetical protein
VLPTGWRLVRAVFVLDFGWSFAVGWLSWVWSTVFLRLVYACFGSLLFDLFSFWTQVVLDSS